MPSLSDLVGQQVRNITRNAANTPSAVVGGVRTAVGNAVQHTVASAGNAVNTTLTNLQNKTSQQLVQGAAGAAEALLRGDFAGAGAALGTAGANISGNILNTFGLSDGSTLSSPTNFTMSDYGGVAPGDALNGLLARPDPQQSCLWFCELPVITGTNSSSAGTGITGVLQNVASSALSNLANTSSGLPWYYVEEATLPMRTFHPRSIYREGRQRHYPGPYTVSDLMLTIYADVEGRALEYLRAWNPLLDFGPTEARTKGGRYKTPSQLMRPVLIHLLSYDKSEIATITCIECWPTGVDSLTLDSNGTDRLTYKVNLSVGDVFIGNSNNVNAAQTSNTSLF